MTPNIDIVGSLKLIAYAPLEYGYKVNKVSIMIFGALGLEITMY
jgi:hypothetical protein